MKNKTIFLLLIIINPILFLTCQKAELPTIGRALLTIQAEATKNQISMSAEIESSGDLEIYERGFNYICYFPSSWDSNDNHVTSWEKEESNYIIDKKDCFAKQLKDIDILDGMYCDVYAYITTNYGKFRSETTRLYPQSPEPMITSIVHDQIAQKIIVKGTGFAFKEKLIKLWTIANEYHGYFNIIKSTPTEIEAKYNHGEHPDPVEIKKIGKYPIKLMVGNKMCKSEAYFELKGFSLEKIEPASFKMGEEITLHIKDFKATDEFEIKIFQAEYYITSIKDNEIKICVNTYTDDGTMRIILYNKSTKYYSEMEVDISYPWEQIDILNNMYVLGSHQEILYGYSYDNYTLYAYNPVSKTSKTSFINPIISQDESKNADMFGTDNYIYLIFNLMNWSIDIDNYKQKIFRMHLGSYTWEQLNEVPKVFLFSNIGPITVWNNQIVYFNSNNFQTNKYTLSKYYLDTDSWEEINIETDERTLIGTYNKSLYYIENHCIYQTLSETLENPKSIYQSKFSEKPQIESAIIHDKYIYFIVGSGLYRIDISSESTKIEPLGKCNDGIIIPTKSGLYLCCNNKIYRYTDELKMD